MEFEFNINLLFPEIISLVGKDTVARRQVHRFSNQHENLQVVIDALGQRSAKAQQLTGSITNLQKSQIHGHHIYVLKNPNANNENGSAIGFIKVGKKRLFLLDHDGDHNEVFPLCILDFYVHESHQRQGCGLRLFNHMLHNEQIQVSHLAIDRPSHKFTSFLKKHFNLWASIPQVNNFVIFEGFFKNRLDPVRNHSSHNIHGRNSRFRPISRAASDDVIRRTGHDASISFQHIRPLSGYAAHLSQGHDPYSNRNNRRRRWNIDGTLQSENVNSSAARTNIYSRFSHETQNKTHGLPPLPRSFNHHGDNVTTNAYRRDSCNKEATKENEEAAVTSPTDNAANQRQEAGDEAKEKQQAVKKVNEEDHKSGMYAKPSDMITELQEKDRNVTSAQQTPWQRNQKWRYLQGSHSSWNVLGVPMFSHWSSQSTQYKHSHLS